MQRLFMYIVILAMFMMAGLIAAPLLVDLDGYKQALLKTIKSSTGLEPIINGRVNVSFFPYPAVTVTNISIENIKDSSSHNILHIESVEVGGTFKALLSGGVDIKEIKLIRPVLELEEQSDGTKNWALLQDSIKKRDLSSSSQFPDKITIVNGTISHSRNLRKSTIDYVSATIISSSANGPFEIEGNFSNNDKTISFEGNIGELKDGAKALFDVKSSSFSLLLDGTYTGGQDPRIEGRLEGASSNLSDFVQALFDSGNKLSQIKSAEKINLAGEFMFSKSTASLSNITIESNSFNGKASVDALLNHGENNNNLQWDVALDITNIDFDELFTEDKKEEVDESEIDYYAYTADTLTLSDFKFDVPKSLSASLDIKIKEINYNSNKIQNLNIATDIYEGKARIRKVSASLPGNSEIRVSGNVDHNGTRPIFNGIIDASGQNLRSVVMWLGKTIDYIPEKQLSEYRFTSDLKMTPQKIDLSNTQLSFDKSLITAEISIRPTSTIPVINAEINIDRLDFDRYGFTKKLNENIVKLASKASSKRLDQTWLQRLNLKFNLNINAKDLIYNGHNIDNYVTSLIVSRGIFNLQRFTIDSDTTKLNSRLLVNLLDGDQPKLDLQIKSKILDTAMFMPSNNQNNKTPWQWSNKPFNFMGIGRFDGNAKISIAKLRHKNFQLSDITIYGDMKDKIFDIEKAEGKLYGGSLSINGRIGASERNPSLGISIVASNINILPFLSNFNQESDTTGQFFFSGTLKTSGQSPIKWIVNLQTNAKIAAKDVKFNKFDLNSIIKNAHTTYSVIDMDAIIKKASSEGETLFSWMDGEVITEKGVLKAQKINIQSKLSRGVFAGNMSMANFDMNGIAKIGFKPERGKNVNLDVRLSGNMTDVKKSLDTTNLELYITEKGRK